MQKILISVAMKYFTPEKIIAMVAEWLVTYYRNQGAAALKALIWNGIQHTIFARTATAEELDRAFVAWEQAGQTTEVAAALVTTRELVV